MKQARTAIQWGVRSNPVIEPIRHDPGEPRDEPPSPCYVYSLFLFINRVCNLTRRFLGGRDPELVGSSFYHCRPDKTGTNIGNVYVQLFVYGAVAQSIHIGRHKCL